MSANLDVSRRAGTLPRWKQILDERLGLSGLAYPVPEHANTLPYLLGGITLFGFVVLIVTGIYLAQFYHADPAIAHDSVIYIITRAPFGDIVRSIHYWTANLVAVTVVLHLLRIIFTGSYKRPREVNWFVGLGLLAVTMLFIFSGTVLKWDQEGVEALAHNSEAANLLGLLDTWFSADFSHSLSLLGRLYNAHITILPALFTLLIVTHVYLIKQHGISPKATRDAITGPTAGNGSSRFTAHLRKMIGVGLILLGVTALLGLIWPAPLGQAGVPGAEVTRPPWMFLWLYPLENLLGVTGLLVVPGVLFGLLAVIPLVDQGPYISPRRRWLLIAIVGVLLLTAVGLGIYAAVQPPAVHLE